MILNPAGRLAGAGSSQMTSFMSEVSAGAVGMDGEAGTLFPLMPHSRKAIILEKARSAYS